MFKYLNHISKININNNILSTKIVSGQGIDRMHFFKKVHNKLRKVYLHVHLGLSNFGLVRYQAAIICLCVEHSSNSSRHQFSGIFVLFLVCCHTALFVYCVESIRPCSIFAQKRFMMLLLLYMKTLPQMTSCAQMCHAADLKSSYS